MNEVHALSELPADASQEEREDLLEVVTLTTEMLKKEQVE